MHLSGSVFAAFAVVAFALSTSALPSPKLNAGPSPSVSAPLDSASQIADLFRIRILQQREDAILLSGTDVKFGATGAIPRADRRAGYHAYKIAKSFSAQHVVWTVTDRDTHERIAQVVNGPLVIDGDTLRVGLKRVPDHLQIESRGHSASDVIATLDLETYLRGVLPSEMPASWPLEALKAQAVAARTFALYRRDHRHEGASFDLESDVNDQMFQNPLGRAQTNVSLENVERAIRETRGETLADSHHEVFAAFFHADCGGHTEEAKEVWGFGQKMGTAVDSGCPLNPRATWSLKISAGDLAAKLAKALKRAPAAVTSLRSGVQTASGRLAEVLVAWNDGGASAITGNDFRAALGFDQLRSTQFSIQHEGSDYVFRGRGFGHGVGMCQWGAQAMAKAGRGYQAILRHYYPRATLVSNRAPEGPSVASRRSKTNQIEM